MTREEICESLKTIITQINETVGNRYEGINSTYIADIKPNSLRFVIKETINALEQKPNTGHWILRPHIYGVAFCSECGYELKINNTNYCPNCGCLMDRTEFDEYVKTEGA